VSFERVAVAHQHDFDDRLQRRIEQDFELVRFVFLDEALRNVFAAARE